MSIARIVLTTVENRETALRIGRTLVDQRLAACVNIVDHIQSVYRWQGAVHDESEVLLIIKTVAGQVEALREKLHEVHPYEVPEFVVIAPEALSERYLAWLMEESS